MADVVLGFHPIEEALQSAGKAAQLYVQQKPAKRVQPLIRLAQQRGVHIQYVPDAQLDDLAGKKADHRGAVLVLGRSVMQDTIKEVKTYLDRLSEHEGGLVLILDGVTDPHNLGAILRSADMFGVDLVVLPQRRSVHQTTTVMKVSAGAAKYVPVVVVKNLVREMQQLQEAGFWFYGADPEGERLQDVSMPRRTGLVMGAEGAGLSRLVKASCDKLVSIPTTGHIDSLNVSVAAGILLYEVRRKG
ncbi:MAG: 23S rRNA (guanosine(2251)-2'-O)-methyltransferase RlmB [Spirochaetota bacterium]